MLGTNLDTILSIVPECTRSFLRERAVLWLLSAGGALPLVWSLTQ